MRKLFTLVITLLLVEICFGSLPKIKIYDKQEDLIKGRFEHVSVTWNGELLLAPAAKQIFASNRLFIWDVVADKKGNLFVATGDGAKIYKVDPNGKINMVSHWDDVEVYSLAIDNKGILYAATSPNGKIYRLYQNKEPQLIVELKVKYIWDMLFDKHNNCYVATGDSGKIYVINDNGDSSIFYKSDETHVRCLAWDGNNHLLAGSYPNGYLYRINTAEQAFIIYDSEYQEIHKICIAKNGTIYAAGLTIETTNKVTVRQQERDTQPKTSTNMPDLLTIPPKPVVSPKVPGSGVIKIQPDGVIKNIWQQQTDQVQSIGLAADDELLIGTGDNGRLYRISPREEGTYLIKFEASQIVSILTGNDNNLWIATSNLGKVFKLESEFVKKGAYESEVLDAKTSTHWGSIQWDQQIPGNCSVTLYSRSGNTNKPNSTWSPWSQVTNGEVIKSPMARFIQWKSELTSKRRFDSPRIKNIKISYLQQNLPPEILSITIHALQRQTQLQPTSTAVPSSLSITSREEEVTGSRKQPPEPIISRQLQNGYRRVTWKAQDGNDDQLSYDLYFQEKSEKNWFTLKKELTRASHSWDTRMMPDGHYRIKVIADDGKSNPINTAKHGEKISDWFIVDNTSPGIEECNIQKMNNDSLQISFKVIDELSPIKRVQISYDIQKWLWVYPKDLVCDSKEEEFKFNIKLDQNQFRSIIVKAVDNTENIGYRRVSIKE